MEKDYTLIKPHHFLDYLYDMGIDYRHEDEVNKFGSNNAALCRDFLDGKFKKIRFTPFVDDICAPCKNLVDNKRCTDFFNDATTLYYGFRYKNDFNYQLDLKLNRALPDIFNFEREFDMVELLTLLKENLTNEIIGYYLWNRENRNEITFIGIDKALAIYKNKDLL